MPHRLTRLLLPLGVTLLVAVLIALIAPYRAARAGQDDSLCKAIPERVTVPRDFVLDACFDGTYLVLRNHKEVVLRVNRSGSVWQGELSSITITPPPAAEMIEFLHSASEPDLLPPEYELRLPVFTDEAGAIEVKAVEEYQSEYALAQGFMTIVGLGGKYTAIATGLGSLNNDLLAAWRKSQTCLGKATGHWGRLACEVNYTRDTSTSLGRFTLNFINGKAQFRQLKVTVSAIRKIIDGASWTSAAVGDLSQLLQGTRKLDVQAKAGGGTTTTPPGSDPLTGLLAAPQVSPARPRNGELLTIKAEACGPSPGDQRGIIATAKINGTRFPDFHVSNTFVNALAPMTLYGTLPVNFTNRDANGEYVGGNAGPAVGEPYSVTVECWYMERGIKTSYAPYRASETTSLVIGGPGHRLNTTPSQTHYGEDTTVSAEQRCPADSNRVVVEWVVVSDNVGYGPLKAKEVTPSSDGSWSAKMPGPGVGIWDFSARCFKDDLVTLEYLSGYAPVEWLPPL